MSITLAALGTINASTDAASFASGSFTPTANRLVLAFVGSTRSGATPSAPTLSGNGLTWEQIGSIAGNTEATPRSRLTLFRAMGASPTTGAVTVDFSGETQQNCVASIFEMAGIDTGGSHGSGAIVQSSTDAADAVQAVPFTLSAFGSASNGAIYGVLKDTTSGVNPESGWTEIHEVGNTSPAIRLETTWRDTEDATVAGSSWAPSANADAMAIVAEIKEFVAAGGGKPWLYYARMRNRGALVAA